MYGECATALYEYERATYARASARIDGQPDGERDVLRQDAYRCEFVARSAIGQALKEALARVRSEMRY